MFDQLKTFFKSLEPRTEAFIDLRVAVAVLLLEAAHRDGEFSPDERIVIERILTKRFSLSREECSQLMESGEATSANLVQLYPYTNAISSRMNLEERVQFVEMLWEVVFADGVLDPEEDALVRRLSTLIHVRDRDRVLARQRVQLRSVQSNDDR